MNHGPSTGARCPAAQRSRARAGRTCLVGRSSTRGRRVNEGLNDNYAETARAATITGAARRHREPARAWGAGAATTIPLEVTTTTRTRASRGTARNVWNNLATTGKNSCRRPARIVDVDQRFIGNGGHPFPRGEKLVHPRGLLGHVHARCRSWSPPRAPGEEPGRSTPDSFEVVHEMLRPE